MGPENESVVPISMWRECCPHAYGETWLDRQICEYFFFGWMIFLFSPFYLTVETSLTGAVVSRLVKLVWGLYFTGICQTAPDRSHNNRPKVNVSSRFKPQRVLRKRYPPFFLFCGMANFFVLVTFSKAMLPLQMEGDLGQSITAILYWKSDIKLETNL